MLHIFWYHVAGGDSKTLMFVQISPSDQDVGETLSSLNFATRVRGVELGPVKKQIDTSELQKTKALVGWLSLLEHNKLILPCFYKQIIFFSFYTGIA